MTLPADSHVHSEWSYDAESGSMERTCGRAVELGLPVVAFTEHVDHTRYDADLNDLVGLEHLHQYLGADGRLTPPPLDVEGYLESVQRCRQLFPELKILTGLELGEPHWHQDAVAALLAGGEFDRVLGSLHGLPVGDAFAEPPALYRDTPVSDVVRAYLGEIADLAGSDAAFAVLAHIDYPMRYWPVDAEPFDPLLFEDEFRHALRMLADSGRALEVNTVMPLGPEIVGWWRDEGGEAISFGSDAHEPRELAHGFAEAVDMVEGYGFRPGRHLHDFWFRPQRIAAGRS